MQKLNENWITEKHIDFEYKKYEEISDILLIPPGTVAIRLKRAKENLKNIINSKGYIHE